MFTRAISGFVNQWRDVLFKQTWKRCFRENFVKTTF